MYFESVSLIHGLFFVFNNLILLILAFQRRISNYFTFYYLDELYFWTSTTY